MALSQKSSINVDQSEIQPKIKLQIKDLVLLPESSDDNNTPITNTNLKDLIRKLNPDSADVSPIVDNVKNNSSEYENDRLKNMKMGWNTYIDNDTIKENEDMDSERQISNSPDTSNTGIRVIDNTPNFSQMALVIP
jgi:hypothetical protein